MFCLTRRLALLLMLVVVSAGCGAATDPANAISVDDNGFPTEWPIALPPGSVNDCGNGEVSREDVFFSVVFCFPDNTDPFVASETYLATLEREGFEEREPGAFIIQQETFLDGNGIEVYYQLVDDEATIVLIKPV